MPKSFTATSITLIPKVNSSQTWADYRPISLCNVSNKILSKLLYTKLAQALPHLISPSQSGFVPGRLISDNILLAQEMIHQLDLRHNRGNLLWASILDLSLSLEMPLKIRGSPSSLMENLQTLKRRFTGPNGNICFPIDEGGLGVRNLRDVIKAFSHKLWWRFRLNNSLGLTLPSTDIVKRTIRILPRLPKKIQHMEKISFHKS
ncbi:UNVERIFIED_CONTAM: hypothetical protein Slati_1771500 [Sesamum latifolium]|uniref:Reverse transcriptase domain-containing protein n=1 Tax=Sesamum latifolium TaxID=2727402 RepID=A0AAW2WYL7_9LAMI